VWYVIEEGGLVLAFTRYCYYQYCKVHGMHNGGSVGGRKLRNSRAIVLQSCVGNADEGGNARMVALHKSFEVK